MVIVLKKSFEDLKIDNNRINRNLLTLGLKNITGFLYRAYGEEEKAKSPKKKEIQKMIEEVKTDLNHVLLDNGIREDGAALAELQISRQRLQEIRNLYVKKAKEDKDEPAEKISQDIMQTMELLTKRSEEIAKKIEETQTFKIPDRPPMGLPLEIMKDGRWKKMLQPTQPQEQPSNIVSLAEYKARKKGGNTR